MPWFATHARKVLGSALRVLHLWNGNWREETSQGSQPFWLLQVPLAADWCMTLSLFGFSQKQTLSTSHLFGRNREYPWRCGKAIKWKIGALSYRDAGARCKATSLNYPTAHKELGASMVFRLWLLYLSCGCLDGAALHSHSWGAFSETGFGS